jgi:hypothetical protein
MHLLLLLDCQFQAAAAPTNRNHDDRRWLRRATTTATRTDHPRLVRLDEVLSWTAGVEKRANKAALLPMGEHQ